MNRKYQTPHPTEHIAAEIRMDELKIQSMQERNRSRKVALGSIIAEIRKQKGLTQKSAATVLKLHGVAPSNIVAIERPSAARSHSVITMMRAYRAFESLPDTQKP